MKKAIIIMMAFIGTFALNAQNKNHDSAEHRKHLQENLTPEQRAELHSKKMTLDLNLNETQQAKVKQLFVDMQKDKLQKTEKRKALTDAQKFETKSAMLDRQIATKKAMKEILTEEQFSKWEKSKQHKPRRNRNKKGAAQGEEK